MITTSIELKHKCVGVDAAHQTNPVIGMCVKMGSRWRCGNLFNIRKCPFCGDDLPLNALMVIDGGVTPALEYPLAD